MRVHVDPEKCQGHNRCYAIAPEFFDVDDLGQCLRAATTASCPRAWRARRAMAVANCPEFAISIAE